jgi:hypothetical protein
VLAIVLLPSASVAQADAFIDRIDAKFQNLSRHPDAG